MPPKSNPPLVQSDLAQFVAQEANFAFEMTALASVRDAGFAAEHAATYRDPISGKIRAFDIRARWTGDGRSLRFAIECKNLRASAPLLIHATPRAVDEATHSVVARYRLGGSLFQDVVPRHNVYAERDAVGRQTDQPIKDSSGDFKSVDSDTYEKWSQAVSGSQDLIREVTNAALPDPEVCAVAPVLVVPDDALWQVDYDERGAVVTPVRLVPRSTIILRQYWSSQGTYGPITYGLSHLEVITLSELPKRLGFLSGPDGLCSGGEELFFGRA